MLDTEEIKAGALGSAGGIARYIWGQNLIELGAMARPKNDGELAELIVGLVERRISFEASPRRFRLTIALAHELARALQDTVTPYGALMSVMGQEPGVSNVFTVELEDAINKSILKDVLRPDLLAPVAILELDAVRATLEQMYEVNFDDEDADVIRDHFSIFSPAHLDELYREPIQRFLDTVVWAWAETGKIEAFDVSDMPAVLLTTELTCEAALAVPPLSLTGTPDHRHHIGYRFLKALEVGLTAFQHGDVPVRAQIKNWSDLFDNYFEVAERTHPDLFQHPSKVYSAWAQVLSELGGSHESRSARFHKLAEKPQPLSSRHASTFLRHGRDLDIVSKGKSTQIISSVTRTIR